MTRKVPAVIGMPMSGGVLCLNRTPMEQMYEESMYHGFISGSELKGFEKIFENEDVCIYRLR